METTTNVPRVDKDAIIDELMDVYLGWREACVEAQAAYRRWSHAVTGDRALTHAAFTAALDREASAADCYRQRAEIASTLWEDRAPPV